MQKNKPDRHRAQDRPIERRNLLKAAGITGVGITTISTESVASIRRKWENVGKKHFVEVGVVHETDEEFTGCHIDQISSYYIDEDEGKVYINVPRSIDLPLPDQIVASDRLQGMGKSIYSDYTSRSVGLTLTPHLDSFKKLPVKSDYQYPVINVTQAHGNGIVVSSKNKKERVSTGEQGEIHLPTEKVKAKNQYLKSNQDNAENGVDVKEITVKVTPKVIVRNHGEIDAHINKGGK